MRLIMLVWGIAAGYLLIQGFLVLRSIDAERLERVAAVECQR